MGEIRSETSTVSEPETPQPQTSAPENPQRRVSLLKKLAARLGRRVANQYLDHATIVPNRGKNRIQVYKGILEPQYDDDEKKGKKTS